MLAEPRTSLTVAYPDQGEAFLMVQSRVLDMPDIVVVQAVPIGSGTSRAIVFSQSRYDFVPFGNENSARVHGLVDALSRRFATPARSAAP